MYTLDWADGWLCIVCTDRSWAEPIEYDLWWPIGKYSRADAEMIFGALPREAMQATGEANGLFAVDPISAYAPCRRVRLLDGGSTKPIKTIEREVPRPKCRVAIRWCQGRWEKRLKSKGWVVA